MGKPRSKLRVILESSVGALAYLTIPWLPRPMLVGLSHLMGRLGFMLGKRQRYVALANLGTVYNRDGRLSDRELRALAIESCQTMSLVALDIFWFGVRTEARLRKYTSLDPSTAAFAAAGGGLVVAAHIGNWEIGGQAGSIHLNSLLSVVAPLRNAFIDRMVSRSRKITGQEVVYQEGAIRPLLKMLRGGGTVALLIDQNVVPAQGGVFVDLFGLPVPVSRAVASLATKARPMVSFVYCLPDRRGHYTIHARDLPEHYAGEGTQEGMTQAIVTLIEDGIREHPGKWMWSYKRWKFIPEGHSGKGYPTYARPIEPPEMKGGGNTQEPKHPNTQGNPKHRSPNSITMTQQGVTNRTRACEPPERLGERYPAGSPYLVPGQSLLVTG